MTLKILAGEFYDSSYLFSAKNCKTTDERDYFQNLFIEFHIQAIIER